MRAALIGIAAIVSVSACTNRASYQKVANQDEAISRLRSFYGTPDGTPDPSIKWMRGDDLNCGIGTDGRARGFQIGPVCYGGLTNQNTELMQVAYPDWYKLWNTNLAHEWYHWHLFVTTGDGDSGHTRPEWTDGTIERAAETLSDL